ncbi:Tetrathionate reductase subunit B [subsurface metagenome]
MASYAMVIDLNRCVRSRTCYVACKKEHRILAHPRDENHPYEYYRLRYAEWEWGEYPMVKRAFIPLICMHCEDPICLKFCPLDAISKRSDGIIVIDKESCNGCGICAHVCPYGALYITPEGKADGCDFCADRLDAGLPPKCVEECPSDKRGAIIFGDLDDPENQVSNLIDSGKARPLLLAGVKSVRVYYVPSPNEGDWDKLATDESFLNALAKRKVDLPDITGVL